LVVIDVALMVQVMINLLDNAVKYSPEKAAIEIIGRQEGKDVVLTILERGIGIPQADLPRIFDRFYRSQLARGIGGLSLGLSICQGIVDVHGGRIWAENRPEGGTAISLALPVEAPPAEG
jgi:two-component system sensor histidine kinase KdpD